MGSLGLWGISRSNAALHSMYEERLGAQAQGQVQSIAVFTLAGDAPQRAPLDHRAHPPARAALPLLPAAG